MYSVLRSSAPRSRFVRGIRTTKTFQSSNMSTTNTPSQNETTTSPTTKEPLALPDIPRDASSTTQLDMSTGSATVPLDHMGPMVINVDGTISRIGNWDKMTEMEQKNTLRIIGKRNKERMSVLKAKDGAGESG